METRKTGDILIFQAGDDWVGKSIAWLTHSEVSHAAMLISPDTMVEMGSRGIAVNGLREGPDGENVYLLRLDPEKDPTPLVQAAQAYIDQGLHFDYPDLVLLAGQLIYRTVRPTARWRKITDLILELACAELDKLLNRMLHKGKKVPAMICSQLVYQCYSDCGPDYQIVLKNALLQDANSAGMICLADLASQARQMDMTAAPDIQVPVDMEPEVLAKELYESLLEADEANEMLLETASLSGTSARVSKFLDLVERILESSGVDLPVPALFVTPCDLLESAVNLKHHGSGKIVRVAKP